MAMIAGIMEIIAHLLRFRLPELDKKTTAFLKLVMNTLDKTFTKFEDSFKPSKPNT